MPLSEALDWSARISLISKISQWHTAFSKTPHFYAHSYNFKQLILNDWLSTNPLEEIFSPS